MKRLAILLLIITWLLPFQLSAQKTSLTVEINQMTAVCIGVDYRSETPWGFRAALGTNPLGFTTYSGNLLGLYHLSPHQNNWQFDLEMGFPILYGNFIEGNMADLDPHIEHPFAGGLFGPSILVGRYSKNRRNFFGIRAGAAYWMEYQLTVGWKGQRIMPILALHYRRE